ncbi:gliding motility-associated C-terminal domain-containing protein, partial [Flavobacterium suzhouense]
GVITYTKTSGEFTRGDCDNSGTYTNTWTATDGCNNTSLVFTQVITIEDTQIPIWSTESVALNVTLECSDTEGLATAQSQAPVAADNCGGVISYTKTSGEFTRGDCDNSGTYTNIWTATDGCNNTSLVFTQVITIEDTQVPIWSTESVALNITLECSDTEGLLNAQAQAPVATDNCGGVITYTKTSGSFVAGACTNAGTYTNTWIANDGCGNSSVEFTQIITLEDTTSPTFIGNLPTDITVSCDEVPVPATLVTSDNCNSENVSVTYNESIISTECKSDYSLIREWIASDCAGNTTSYTQTITVRDTTPPTGTAPEDLYLQDVSDIPDASPSAVTNVMDNCSDTVDISVTDEDNGGVGCADDPYIITRTFILSDCSGNTTTLVQTITVILSDLNVQRVSGTACNQDTVQVDLNSYLPNDIPAGGTWRGTNNSLNVDRGLLDVFGLQAGIYEFEYIKLAEICPSLFMSLRVNENCKVVECEPILVHNAFSPNGDNINEKFVIDNIDNTTCYPDNTVEIYNRWGILVFETRNYNNTTNAFEGISKGRTTISQAEGLPTGTYFYILNYSSVDGNGTIQTHNKSGYLFLSR